MKGSDKTITFLGKETHLEGKLKFEGALRIDGHFDGEITAKGNLIIGEEALVKADILVSYASISGEFHGNITAEQRIDLHAPGKVFGNIQAPSVVIDEGVIFEGSTRMYQARAGQENGHCLYRVRRISRWTSSQSYGHLRDYPRSGHWKTHQECESELQRGREGKNRNECLRLL